jgi:glycosyltransferase involved in cell wall biosynthesis
MNATSAPQPGSVASGDDASGPSAAHAALIDVVIPVHDCAATVGEAVASIQRQTVRDIRIVVVDDGSTDGTLDVVRQMAARDPRIHVIGKANGGIVDALNLGLSVCTAPYLARHDGDDLAYPERFERQLAYLAANPECVAVGAWARLIDADGRPTGEYSAQADAVPAREPYLLHPFLMARLAAVQAIGGYRHNLLAEDADLYWRLQEVGALVNLPETLGDYRVHTGSTTARSIARGRMNALFSEMAALSAMRRRRGRPDIEFTRAFVAEVTRCEGLPAVVAAGEAKVFDDERRWLRIAVAAKLIDLCFIRHYRLELDDCRFIRAAYDAGWGLLDVRGRVANTERLIRIAKALIEQGRIGLAAIVSPPRLYVRLLPRLAFRWLVPEGLRRKAKALAGRA